MRRLIFSTGNTCIDIDFDRLVDGQKDVSMIYTESDGSLRERLLSRDKKDKVFQKLSASSGGGEIAPAPTALAIGFPLRPTLP